MMLTLLNSILEVLIDEKIYDSMGDPQHRSRQPPKQTHDSFLHLKLLILI